MEGRHRLDMESGVERVRYKSPYWNAIYTPNNCRIGSNAKSLNGRTRALPTKAFHLHCHITHESVVSRLLSQMVPRKGSRERNREETVTGMEDSMGAEGRRKEIFTPTSRPPGTQSVQ